MKITLSPMRRDDRLSLSKVGDTLTINGEALDFSGLPNGATLPREAIDCGWIAGNVERDETGGLTVPLVLPHGMSAPDKTRFPGCITVTEDGPVDLPPHDTEETKV